MDHRNPVPGLILGVNLVGANAGDVWTGFEWVTPERYEALRSSTMPELPPMQPTPGGALYQQPCRDKFNNTLNFGGGATSPDRLRIEEAVANLLEVVDPNADREGLAETPSRAAKAWEFWTSGYHMNPADVLKVFEDGAQGCDEMVVVRDIPVYSKCEHHLADIFGYATVGYIPNGRIVGLSKINRLVDVFARRLQVQERMTNQVADALMEHLTPHGCGVVIKARHMCMESRGVRQGSHTITSALRGVFKDDPTVRAEFLALGREVRNA